MHYSGRGRPGIIKLEVSEETYFGYSAKLITAIIYCSPFCNTGCPVVWRWCRKTVFSKTGIEDRFFQPRPIFRHP